MKDVKKALQGFEESAHQSTTALVAIHKKDKARFQRIAKHHAMSLSALFKTAVEEYIIAHGLEDPQPDTK